DAYNVFVITGAAGGVGRHLTRVLLGASPAVVAAAEEGLSCSRTRRVLLMRAAPPAEAGKTVVAVDVYEAGLRALAESDWKGHGDRLVVRRACGSHLGSARGRISPSARPPRARDAAAAAAD